ncbi:MAG: alpha/beta hydrolase, partial [Clostridiales Family XIII bacterium]|nr:alpha/beta hydrolase [Clostridiales Family XIII bacterium]
MTVNANEKNTALDMQEVIQLGKINPFRDENGKMLPESVSEITHMIIGGMSQGMIIRGRNSKNPVILYVHGGPGIPEYAFGSKFRILLEQECTICWWEERGAGISYHPKIPGETMTLNQMINDTIEVANYLRKRFDKEKIYLMGSSWGSLIGAYVASLRPDLFYAYIGISQVSNQFESVKTAYDYMLKISEKNGDRVSVSKLKKYR